MAVSPEGSVRYWHSIAHESSYTEVSTELQGQECDCLVYLSGRLGYYLTTTTSTCLLLLPVPSPRSGEPGVSVRLVKSPAGLLGGLSRRVTSLMFGSLPTQTPEARLIRVVCRSSAADSVEVLVLSAEHLQCWQLSAGSSTDVLLYQAPLLQLLKQALAAKILSGSSSLAATQPVGGATTPGGSATKGSSGVWLLDAQPQPHAPSQLVVLVAAINPARGNELTLALGEYRGGAWENLETRRGGDLGFHRGSMTFIRLCCTVNFDTKSFDETYAGVCARFRSLVYMLTYYHQLGRLVSESACEREDLGSYPAAAMVDAARITAWDLGTDPRMGQK
ncbi:Nucleoporin Nup133/Nup155-like N-terminal, partial [Trinorchestia longiramus]